jgi:pyridoxamine 5'-phosphate oxidase
MTISNLRRDYLGKPLDEADAGDDPFALFTRWFEEAREVEPNVTAMTLATATLTGRPSTRTVLLKDFDHRGFVFYTNYRSRKARELAENNRASMLFFWPLHERQVRIDGTTERVSSAESDAYFQTRPVESRISVYASHQSARLEGRHVLDASFEAAANRFPDGQIPRPDWWGGYRVRPEEIEFWQGRVSRLHDRLWYARQPDGTWRRERLAP